MLGCTARSKVTWGAVVAALIVGLALLLMLRSPSFHPKPAQAQTAAKTVLTIDGFDLAEFSTVDEVTSSIQISLADGTAAKPQPISIVLERTADDNLQLASWHEAARTHLSENYRRDATLTFYDSSGTPTLKLFLNNAWPSQYQLEQQGTQMVERVTLTADDFQRLGAS
jgi:hypothetical protein